jgi:hypothetical protein
MKAKEGPVQLFILFQECTPIHFYTKTNKDLIMEEDIKNFFQDLDIALEHIQIENHKGFFDVDNVNAFLSNYDILDDYYPVSPRRKLRQSLKTWMSWKQERESKQIEEYKIKKTPSKDNSFGEIHARKTKYPNNKYLLISLDSICFRNQLVNVEKTSDASIEQIECIELKEKLKKWFDNNRIPPRIYHASPKHAENGRGEWQGASKLLCSHVEAAEMLSRAVGINGIDELYYYDENHSAYIIFRYEGDTGENKFHAYHLTAKDVDRSIKRILEKAIELYSIA